ncbi:MAG: hypothetical protein GXY86_09550 [Firmicutes bacterium]|nr:hypothetical protein [Bacillota bacterium]
MNGTVINHNKLNQLIIANQERYLKRQAAMGPEGKTCPICHGENRECRYFELQERPGLPTGSPEESLNTVQDREDYRTTRLKTVKEGLLGRMVTVSDFDGEYTVDLGKSLIVAGRYLNLEQPLEEIPLLKEIMNRLIPGDPERQPVSRVCFSSLVLKSEEIPNLMNLNEASRQMINDTIREKMVQENIHSSWEWLPVLLRGKEISHLPEGKKYFNAVELLDKETFCRCLELVYQHFSSVEDEFLARMNPTNINQCRYPCEDYHQSRAKIKKTLKQAQAAILAKLNTIKEGQVDE